MCVALSSILALYVFLDIKSGRMNPNTRKKQYESDDFNADLTEQPIGTQHDTSPDDNDLNHEGGAPFEGIHYKAEAHSAEPYGSIQFSHDEPGLPTTTFDEYHGSSSPHPIDPDESMLSPSTSPIMPFIPDESSSSPASSCTVHVPVTIHLKGTLAIKMKNCVNCDFSKNIESIGPLKVAPLNNNQNTNLAEDLKKATNEAEVRSTFHANFRQNVEPLSPAEYNQRTSNILDYLTKSDSIDFDKYILERDNTKYEGNLEKELRRVVGGTKKDNTVSGTKKHVTAHVDDMETSEDTNGVKKDDSNDLFEKKDVVIDKHIFIPKVLVPEEAYKKGVIVSLPKGKAVLKCVLTKDLNAGDETIKTSNKITNNKDDNDKSIITPDLLNESNLQKAVVGELKKNVKPNAIAKQEDIPQGDVARFTAAEVLHRFHKNDKLTERFMKLFDKDMIVSLYRIAVNDIMADINRKKSKNLDGQVARKKMELLGNERPYLEKRFPGFQDTLDEDGDLEPLKYSKKRKRFILYTSRDDTGFKQRHAIRSKRSEKDKENFYNKHKHSIQSKLRNAITLYRKSNKLQPQKVQTSRGTRRVKLVDTYRPFKTVKSSKKLNIKTWPFSHTRKDDQALSFYGDLDPSKLTDENPNCIEELCEKQKQFIKHAGQYFQNLDNLALEPYKQFLNDKEKQVEYQRAPKKITFKLPYGEAINIDNMKRNKVTAINTEYNKSKRETIIEGYEDKNSKSGNTPNTIVELFGKLPRVPLKITLNPKGPLAKLKKTIEIDLKPPSNGEPASKVTAKTNDPGIEVHIANKLFKDATVDPKEEEKLQKIYSDIKRNHIASVDNKKRDIEKEHSVKCSKNEINISNQGDSVNNKDIVKNRAATKEKVDDEEDNSGDSEDISNKENLTEEDNPINSFEAEETSDKEHLTEESCDDKKSAEDETKSIKASDVEIDDKITCENETNAKKDTTSSTTESKGNLASTLNLPSDSALFNCYGDDDPVTQMINTSDVSQREKKIVQLCKIGSNNEILNTSLSPSIIQNKTNINAYNVPTKKEEKVNSENSPLRSEGNMNEKITKKDELLNKRSKKKKRVKNSHTKINNILNSFAKKHSNTKITNTLNSFAKKHPKTESLYEQHKLKIPHRKQHKKEENGRHRSSQLAVTLPLPTTTNELISPFTAPVIDPYTLKLPHDSAIIKHPIKGDPVQKVVNLSQDKDARNFNLVTICNEAELNKVNTSDVDGKCRKSIDKLLDSNGKLSSISEANNGSMQNRVTNMTGTDKILNNMTSSDKILNTTEVNVSSVNKTGNLSAGDDKMLTFSTISVGSVNKTGNMITTGNDTTHNLTSAQLRQHTLKSEWEKIGKINKQQFNSHHIGSKEDTEKAVWNKVMEKSQRLTDYVKINQQQGESIEDLPNLLNINVKTNFVNNNDNTANEKFIQEESAADDLPKRLNINIKTKGVNKTDNNNNNNNEYYVLVNASTHQKDVIDPYSDLGSESSAAKRSDVVNKSMDSLVARYQAATIDPYSTLGSLIFAHTKGKLPESSYAIDKEASKRIAIPKKQKEYSRRGPPKSKRNRNAYKKQHIDKTDRKIGYNGVGAISLIRHTTGNIIKTFMEEKYSAEGKVNDLVDKTAEVNANKATGQIISDPNIKVDTDKPLSDADRSSMLAAFPQFKEELSKINPETKKKLFLLKPFKFLSPLANNVTQEDEQQVHDPYADMGQVVEPKSKIRSNKKLYPYLNKNNFPVRRSETYDPYADMGTSIGLSQNEARAHIKYREQNDTYIINDTKSHVKSKDSNELNRIKSSEEEKLKEKSKQLTKINEVEKSGLQNENLEMIKGDGKSIPQNITQTDESLASKVHQLRAALQSDIEKNGDSFESKVESGISSLMDVAMNNSFFPVKEGGEKNGVPNVVHLPQLVVPFVNSRSEKQEADKAISKI